MKGSQVRLERTELFVHVGAAGWCGGQEWVDAQPLTDLFCWFAWANNSGFGSLKFGTSE